MIKSCFPNSDLFGSPADHPAAEINEQFTVSNARAVYNSLLTCFAKHLDKLFILITPPPQNESEYNNDYQSASHRAANARAVNNWLINNWLSGYPHDNVAVFDYFNVLTGENNFPAVEVSTLSGLETGTHTFCFGVDWVMNKALDAESLAVDCISITITRQNNETGERLQPNDFQYQGAFRLPDEFSWGARGLSYYPKGDGGKGSLFVTGKESPLDASGAPCYEDSTGCQGYFAEIAIPSPRSADDWEALPEAEYLRPMTAFDNGMVHTLTTYAFVSGIEYVPGQGSQTTDKIYASLNAWYAEGVFGEETFPSIWFNELDGSNARGLFHVGPDSSPYHGRKMGDYLFTVPRWYADQYLGGRILVTGRSRGTPLGSENGNVAGGSQGPTLFAFHPWQTDTPHGHLDALPMLYYRAKYPECAGPDIGVGGTPVDCDYPGFTMCDAWTGAGFVENGEKRAILISGLKGTTNCYYCGDLEDDSQCLQEPLPGECDLYCNESRGYHCGPYERQVIFYDPDEVGLAAQGNTEPWQVLPYATWRPDEFFLGDAQGNTCADVGGMAADNTGRRLFVIERGLGGFQNQNAAVIHVWSL